MNETKLARGGKLGNQVGVLGNFHLRLGNQQSARHSQMNNPMPGKVFALCRFISALRISGRLNFFRRGIPAEIQYDVLAGTVHAFNAGAFQQGSDGASRRLQRLRLAADPDRFDHVSRDTLGQTAGYGFNFRKFTNSCIWRCISSMRSRICKMMAMPLMLTPNSRASERMNSSRFKSASV